MNNKGITLIEIIVTIAILSIIIVPLSSFFITTAKTNKITDEKYEATLLAQSVIESIKSLDVINEENLDDIFDDLKNYNSVNDNIVFNYSPVNSNNNLTSSVNIVEHVYKYQDDSSDDSDDSSDIVHIIINETEDGYEVVLKRYSPPVFENYKDKNDKNTKKNSDKDISVIIIGDSLKLTLIEDKKNKNVLIIEGEDRTVEVDVKSNHLDENKLNVLNLTSDLNINDFIDENSLIKFSELSGSSNSNKDGIKFYEINVYVNKGAKELESLKGSMIIYE